MGSATASILLGLALAAICTLAFSIRLFSVFKYESVIHEFDPYFNYRVTQFLTKEGFYDMWNWFDDRTWYPLGRVVGGTMYPGLIITAGLMHKALHAVNIPIHVQEVCVFTAPVFSALCALVTYHLGSEIRGPGAGLLAATGVALVPSYISRSVAGSFDLEAVAIFALMLTFFMYLKALRTGSLAWSMGLVAAYFYMVLSWGGYSFVINLLPMHCLVMVATGRLTPRLYVAYCPLIVIGTVAAASIPVIGFNAVFQSEHFAGFLAFVVLHVALAVRHVHRLLPPEAYRRAKVALLTTGCALVAALLLSVATLAAASPTLGWSGRSLSLLDPTYASRFIPIIASVSEHQPPTWNAYFQDLNMLVLLMPAGLAGCFLPRLTDASLFLALYAVTSVYFSGVMVRLMLVLAPAACLLAAIGGSDLLDACMQGVKASPKQIDARFEQPDPPTSTAAAKPAVKAAKKRGGGSTAAVPSPQPPAPARSQRKPALLPKEVAVVVVLGLTVLLLMFTTHCVHVSANLYSAPSIVLQSRGANGALHVFDDFRETYAWMSQNTEDDAVIASWWDYGYQTTAMANRTVLVDNNTWNTTHIATVGRALASPEKKAWRILRSLDVTYVFVVFGGVVGYPSDDLNKFLWMVRIASNEFPDIQEKDFMSSAGYKVDEAAPKALRDSIMFKLSYYRYGDLSAAMGRPPMDRVRQANVVHSSAIRLQYFEEVYTSEHWMVRVYKLLPKPNRESSSGTKARTSKRELMPVKRRSQSGVVMKG